MEVCKKGSTFFSIFFSGEFEVTLIFLGVLRPGARLDIRFLFYGLT